VKVGHHKTGWCNIANIAYRTGTAFEIERANQLDVKEWQGLLLEMKQLMAAYSLDMNDAGLKLGPMLTVDPEAEVFTGEHAGQANRLLKRQY